MLGLHVESCLNKHVASYMQGLLWLLSTWSNKLPLEGQLQPVLEAYAAVQTEAFRGQKLVTL